MTFVSTCRTGRLLRRLAIHVAARTRKLPPFLQVGVLASCCLLTVWATAAQADEETPRARRLNVLFIAVDDLRPELGCYGAEHVRSPHIDALAGRGTVFSRAYCQQAVCGPSRTSLLTGLRPDTTRVWDLRTHFRRAVPHAVTLPEHFKNHGYHAQSLGKVFHGSFPPEAYRYYRGFVDVRDRRSWSVPEWFGSPRYYYTPEGVAAARAKFARISGKRGPALDSWVHYFLPTLATEAPEVADNVLYDGQLADAAIEALGEVRSRPFFLAVGFLRPHLPFVAPRKYWDLYDRNEIKLTENDSPPKGVPAIAMHDSGELRSYSDIPGRGPISEEQGRRLIHGYRACVSYVDAQIGRLLTELDRLKLRDHTIVCLWGDHGWHLGDNGLWGKQTNFEMATRVPLVVVSPEAKAPGQTSDALVELVDVYPTLVELAGLPAPEDIEGRSFARLLDDSSAEHKSAALSQYPRGRTMGRSIRTDRYRFTSWQDRRDVKGGGGIELYDHENDPGESRNIAELPENASLVEALEQKLTECWKP